MLGNEIQLVALKSILITHINITVQSTVLRTQNFLTQYGWYLITYY